MHPYIDRKLVVLNVKKQNNEYIKIREWTQLVMEFQAREGS